MVSVDYSNRIQGALLRGAIPEVNSGYSRRGTDCNLTTQEIVERFASYCSEHHWGMSSTTAEEQLPDLMMELFKVSKSHNIERDVLKSWWSA